VSALFLHFLHQATTEEATANPERTIPYEMQDYWTGQPAQSSKANAARSPTILPPILERLKIAPGSYVRFINQTQKSRFHGFIGSVKSMRSLAENFGRSFLKGQAAAAALFSPG